MWPALRTIGMQCHIKSYHVEPPPRETALAVTRAACHALRSPPSRSTAADRLPEEPCTRAARPIAFQAEDNRSNNTKSSPTSSPSIASRHAPPLSNLLIC